MKKLLNLVKETKAAALFSEQNEKLVKRTLPECRFE